MTHFMIKFEADIASPNNVRTNEPNFSNVRLFKSGYPLDCMRIPYSFHEIGVVPVDM
jgi:hypothetical protein